MKKLLIPALLLLIVFASCGTNAVENPTHATTTTVTTTHPVEPTRQTEASTAVTTAPTTSSAEAEEAGTYRYTFDDDQIAFLNSSIDDAMLLYAYWYKMGPAYAGFNFYYADIETGASKYVFHSEVEPLIDSAKVIILRVSPDRERILGLRTIDDRTIILNRDGQIIGDAEHYPRYLGDAISPCLTYLLHRVYEDEDTGIFVIKNIFTDETLTLDDFSPDYSTFGYSGTLLQTIVLVRGNDARIIYVEDFSQKDLTLPSDLIFFGMYDDSLYFSEPGSASIIKSDVNLENMEKTHTPADSEMTWHITNSHYIYGYHNLYEYIPSEEDDYDRSKIVVANKFHIFNLTTHQEFVLDISVDEHNDWDEERIDYLPYPEAFTIIIVP